jgi:hypothetical protein
MTAQHRHNEITRTTIHRVYYLGEELREAMADRRRALGLTLRAFLAEAIEGELPALVEVLCAHLPPPGEKTRPARLPLTEAILGLLRDASTATGVPAAKLLAACLTRAAARKRRRRAAPPDQTKTPKGRRRKTVSEPFQEGIEEGPAGPEDIPEPTDPAS